MLFNLSKQAGFLGWEVNVIVEPSYHKELSSFQEVKNILYSSATDFDISLIDEHSAILLMTHNYARDLQFLTRLKDSFPVYLGVLGGYEPARKTFE